MVVETAARSRLLYNRLEEGMLWHSMQSGGLWKLALLTRLAAKHTRSLSTAVASGEPRQLFAACVLERLPVVIPEEFPYEVDYQALKERLFQKYRQDIPAEFTKVLGDEVEAAGEDGRGAFQPAPRVTEADHKKDTKSLHRALDKRLFLLVKAEGTGPRTGWTFPQVAYSQEATIRQTAESALEQALAPSHVRQVYFVGNSPAGHSEYEDGATVFFHRAQLIKGDVALQQGGAYSDYVWATRSELPEYVEDSTEQTLFKLILSE